MTRNNHPGGGFVRLTLVPLEKVKDKAVHAANAFHYSCWGSNIVVASGDALNPPDKYGYSMVGSDGQTHSHPKAYYKTSAEIPDVVPDGSYMLGWAWFGGVTGGVKGNFVQEPTHWSYFADYWSCSFVAVKGGKPLASSYTPKFINDMSQFSSDGCMAHANDIGLCTYEPCLDRKSFYQKPAAFNGSGPKPITPENFGGEVPPVDEVPKETPKADPPRETPTTEPPNETPTVEPPKETPTVELPKETPKAEDPVYTDPPTENPDPVYFDRGLMSCLCIAGSSDMCFKELASYTDNCDAHERYYRQPSGCAESCCAFCKKTGDKFSACRNANTQRACSGN